MSAKELEARLAVLSEEATRQLEMLTASNEAVRRALIRAYFFWRDCSSEPDFLESLYKKHDIRSRATTGNAPNFSPLLRLIFNLGAMDQRKRQALTRWNTALVAIDAELTKRPKRYRFNPEGKLLKFIVARGGISGFARQLENEQSDREDDPPTNSAPRFYLSDKNQLPNPSQTKQIGYYAVEDIKQSKGLTNLALDIPLRASPDKLVALLARRDDDGSITLLGSTSNADVINSVAQHAIDRSTSHLETRFRTLVEVIRTQTYPSVGISNDSLLRRRWFDEVLMDHSDLFESDLPSWEGKGKGNRLKSYKKLLIRGDVCDIVMSGTRVKSSVVTRFLPSHTLVPSDAQVFLQAKDRGLIEKFIETGEITLINADEGNGLDASRLAKKGLYELNIHSAKLHGRSALHFFDAKQDAGVDHSYQAYFDSQEWKPEWRFTATNDWFLRVREDVLDHWFQSLGKHKQVKRDNNMIMQVALNSTEFELRWNISEHGEPATAKFEIAHDQAFDGEFVADFLSKDLGPVFYNITDVGCVGNVSVSGSADAMLLEFMTQIGSMQIAIPTVAKVGDSFIRQSKAFSELRYG